MTKRSLSIGFLLAALSTACLAPPGPSDDDDDAADDDVGDDDTTSSGSLCVDFYNVYFACFAEAGFDVSGLIDVESICENYSDHSFDAGYECAIDMIQEGDCSSYSAAGDTVDATQVCFE